jgi:CHAT domain-containing protein
VRALRDVGFDQGKVSIPRLPFSRSEADSILAVVSPKESLEALDFNASLTTLRRTDLSKYRFIHFATHGLLNSDYPELSGILLSMVDEKGKPVDGFLQLNEIYNLKLAADLVVLSACQTALGKDVKGEGLMGLTRGFMHAGARRVVGGLWKVDDAATAALMENFYREMFINGKRPAAALREAQISLSKQKRWQSPYYWAGFVLQGDWR